MNKPVFNLSHSRGCLMNLFGFMGVLHWVLLTSLIKGWENQLTVF